MKKNLFRMMAVVAVILAFSACKDDETDGKSKATFSFNVESLTLDSAPGSRGDVEVTTNSDDFSVVIPEDGNWLTYTKEGKTARFVIAIENPSYDNTRSVTVQFRGAGTNTSGGSAPFVVTQRAALREVSFAFAPTTLQLDKASGSFKSVAVTTSPSCDFTVTIPEGGEGWLDYSKNENNVTFTAKNANEGTADRTATITFTSQGSTVKSNTGTLTVTQTFKEAATFSFAPATIELENTVENSKPVTVTTNSSDFSVTITTGSDWLGYDRAEGSNTVTFKTLTANADPANGRTATVTFAATGSNTFAGSETYTVTQKVGDPLDPFTFSFNPATSVNIANTMSATAQVEVTTNSSAYSATTTAGWLTIGKGQVAEGKATVTFTVTGLNTDLDNTRTATINFTGTGANTDNTGAAVTYQVIQAKAAPMFVKEGDEVSVGGATGSTADAPFQTNLSGVTVSSNGASWFAPAFDPATKKVVVTIAEANDADEARTGTLTITPPAGYGLSAIDITVKQRVYVYPSKIYNDDVNGVKGVVFWVDPDDDQKAKIISLSKVTNTAWANNTVDHTIDGVTGKTDTFVITGAMTDDGEINTNAVWDFAENNEVPLTNFPAFKFCKDMNTDANNKWYVPSVEEVITLYEAYWGKPKAEKTTEAAESTEDEKASAQKFEDAISRMEGMAIQTGTPPSHTSNYWSSSQASTNAVRASQCHFHLAGSAVPSVNSKYGSRAVRCVMKVSY